MPRDVFPLIAVAPSDFKNVEGSCRMSSKSPFWYTELHHDASFMVRRLLLRPSVSTSLLFGAMMPYAFAALTMKAQKAEIKHISMKFVSPEVVLVVSLVSGPSLFIVLVRRFVGLLTPQDHASGYVPAGRWLSPPLNF